MSENRWSELRPRERTARNGSNEKTFGCRLRRVPVSHTYSPSVRDLLLVIVFQLGICVLLLSEVADATRGYGSLIGLLGQIVGVVTVAAALLVFVTDRGVGAQ